MGLSYNKCKIMDEMLAAAFEVLRFERLLEKPDDVEDIKDTLKLQIKDIETDCSAFFEENDKTLDRYDKFCQETEIKVHGKTGTFRMKYIRLMHIYHILTCSVRTGDFDLYVFLKLVTAFSH